MSVQFTWHGPQVTQQVRDDLAKGLFDAGQYLLQEAQQRVPMNRGMAGGLMSSGESHVDKAKMEVIVSYGNDGEHPYAARLHEHPEYNFQHGREGKWLEKVFKLYGRTAWQIVAKHI